MMVIAAFLASFLCLRRAKKTELRWEDIVVVIAATFGACIFFGSLLYVFITYSWDEIWYLISNFKLDVLFGGGIVFYGGLIGGIAAALVTCRLLKINIASLEYCAVPFIPLAHAIGRIGCLLAGCCYGCVYDGPLAVSYPNAVTTVSKTLTYFPVQPLEAALDIVIMVILLYIAKKPRRTLDLLSAYVAMYAVMRFITEMFRGDAIRGIFGSFSTSQWISIGLLAVILIRFIVLKIKEKKSS